MAHEHTCSVACEILLDQGSNPCLLRWRADSRPLDHQGNPNSSFLISPKHSKHYFKTSCSPHLLFKKGRVCTEHRTLNSGQLNCTRSELYTHYRALLQPPEPDVAWILQQWLVLLRLLLTLGREVFVQSRKRGPSGASDKSPLPLVFWWPHPLLHQTPLAPLSDKPVNQMTDNRENSWKHLLVKGWCYEKKQTKCQ